MNAYFLGLLGCLTLATTVATSAAQAVTVLRVLDGDTIHTTAGRIRLACIDAPEVGQSPFGWRSKSYLASLLPVGSSVRLRGVSRGYYGRTVAEVFAGSSSVNLQMVRAGEAFAYGKYLSGCNREQYLGAEAAAQSRGLGVWSVPGGIQKPWLFRR